MRRQEGRRACAVFSPCADSVCAAMSHGVSHPLALLEGKVRKQDLENFTFHGVDHFCNKQNYQEGIITLW